MSKLTLSMTLFCALVLFAAASKPASALSAGDAAKTRGQRVERTAPAGDAAKIAFLQSLVQGKQPAKSPRRPTSNKLAREACTSDGPVTTCCAPCGCCTWFAEDQSPRCISNC